MFGRGTWAIYGLGKESLDTFRTFLEDRPVMVTVSQMAASSITRYSRADTIGINPFSGPRLDEEHPVGVEHESELAGYAASELEERASLTLADERSSTARATALPKGSSGCTPTCRGTDSGPSSMNGRTSAT